jgi:hypothetical protein
MQLNQLIIILAFLVVSMPITNGINNIKINFDIHLTCGKYHGAEGRLFVGYNHAVRFYKN